MPWLAQDNANRADNADLGAIWIPVSNSLRITSTLFRPTADALDCCEYYALPMDPNQYAQVRIIGIPTSGSAGRGIGPSIRNSPTQFTNYNVVCSTNGTELWSVSNGTFANIQIAAAPTSGDIIRLEAIGTTIIVRNNGNAVITVTSTIAAAGYPGMECFQDAATVASCRDWEAGDFNYQVGGILVNQGYPTGRVAQRVAGY